MTGRAPCPRETAIVEAIRRGSLDPSLEEHRAACSGCDEVATIARLFREPIDAGGDPAPPLPDPGLIWWKAQLAARREAAARATRPILWVESAAWAIVLLACAGIAVWQAPAFLGVARSFRAQLSGMHGGLAGGDASLTMLALLCVLPVMVLAAVATALRPAMPRHGRPRQRS